MFRFVALVALLPALISAFDIIACPGVNEPTSFAITQCPGGSPCGIEVGQEIELLIGIHVVAAVQSLPTTATIELPDGTVVDFPIGDGDACNAIEGGCPQAAGDYLVRYAVTVGGVPSDVNLRIEVRISDQNGFGVACGAIIASFS